jgi:hypothetical protein
MPGYYSLHLLGRVKERTARFLKRLASHRELDHLERLEGLEHLHCLEMEIVPVSQVRSRSL